MDGMDLVEFLRARLDEDEQAAKAWLPFGNPDAAQREHVARHDPARVLAEVEAKRLMINEHTGNPEALLGKRGHMCGSSGYHTVTNPCFTLRLLALPYADHDDYHSEWRLDK